MEAVTVCLHSKTQPTMFTQCGSNPVCTNQLAMDLTGFQDFVFLLGKHWELNLDHIKSHWACSLCASGLVDHGSRVSAANSNYVQLLSFAMCNSLVYILHHVRNCL